MKKTELLAPAGDFEKMKYALHYGADAVYCAGKRFGMRSNAGNFTDEELAAAAEYVHSLGKRIYVTVNITAGNDDIAELPEYVRYLDSIGIDHLIAADPGVILTIRETAPDMKISVSTQANTQNWKSCEFWHRNGAGRIVLARELGLSDITEIVQKSPEDLEIEVFVHGAMCISNSGRCLLSNYMTGRDANKGDCAQPCRWNYSLRPGDPGDEVAGGADLIERERPDQKWHIEEDERGSFIFNSKDLCLIDKIPELMEAGVTSFKIEGRMKSIYYVATVVSAYRQMIDAAAAGETEPETAAMLRAELEKVSHRDYTTAFYDRKTDERDQNYGSSSYVRSCDYAGLVLEYDEKTGTALVEQRNKLMAGDDIELLRAGKSGFLELKDIELFDEKMRPIESTPHAKMRFRIRLPEAAPMDILRRPVI